MQTKNLKGDRLAWQAYYQNDNLSADAIWATQLRPNGHYKLDRKGRAIKGRVKRRDFRHTVTYYHFEQIFPKWSRQHLRTTSRLERFNRTVRFRLKAANAYHSDAGLQAMMAQETHAFNHAQALN